MMYNSGTSSNPSPDHNTIYDLEKVNHPLALLRNSQCEILSAFMMVERQSGRCGVYIDTMLCKSYKGLAPLPYVLSQIVIIFSLYTIIAEFSLLTDSMERKQIIPSSYLWSGKNIFQILIQSQSICFLMDIQLWTITIIIQGGLSMACNSRWMEFCEPCLYQPI